MNEHTIPFETLIKKREVERYYPSCEQEPGPNRLLRFSGALFKCIKAVFRFSGIVLSAVFSTCLSVIKYAGCLIALILLLAVL